MRKAIYILAVMGGAVAAVGGPLLGLALVALASAGGRGQVSALQGATMGLAMAAIGLAMGASLVWAGVQALRERPDRPFWLPAWGWWLAAGLIALALGQAVARPGSPALVLLPFLHLLAGAAAALLFLSLALGAARDRDGVIKARPGLSSLAWGALGGTGLGIFAELVLLLVLAIVAVLFLALVQPDVLAQLQSWAMSLFQRPSRQPDLTPLGNLITSPLVATSLLALIGVAVPLIEELAKSLAVPLVALTIHRARPAPAAPSASPDAPAADAALAGAVPPEAPGPRLAALTRLDGFLIGVAAGAGFGLVEGTLNGSLALVDLRTWGLLMAVRGGTAAIHCLATGLGGLAWQAALAERRWLRALGFAVAAVAVHGAWNLGAGATGLASLAGEAQPGAAGFTAVFQVLATGGMAALWLLAVVALPLIARQLATPPRGPGGGAQPLGAPVVPGLIDAGEGTGVPPAASSE